MSSRTVPKAARPSVVANPKLPLSPAALLAFLVAVVAVVVIALLAYGSLRATARSADSLTRSVEVLTQLQTVLSTLKDAETGQRGFLLTGRESYLEPYLGAQSALPGELATLTAMTADNPAQTAQLNPLKTLAAEKMNELAETIALERAGQADQALARVRTDRGKALMDRLRMAAEQMQVEERQLIALRTAESRSDAAVSFGVTGGGAAVLLVLIGTAAVLSSREFKKRQLDLWLRAGQLGVSEAARGDQTLEQLAQNVLSFVAEFVGAQVGAIFVADRGGFRCVGGFALPAGGAAMIRPGEGLAGEAVRANRPLRVRQVPPGYLPVQSSLGRADTDELLIAPASIDGAVHAVLELGFFGAADAAKEEFVQRISESVAVAVRAAADRSRLEELLHETQRQAEALQTSEEELRVNNEELEEQSRALRESRGQLESQQAELEQINAQLEEQTAQLEQQRDELAQSHGVLTARTADLQRANEYKSEFLANMSHELRTPLNSTLILAKLLADNKDGNLTETQVKFAQTISSAGNDLLTLINDVLDLSRIEAGKIDLAMEPVTVARVIDSLTKVFQPTADQKRLTFAAIVEPGTPAELATDPQRLGQILRNLLSNAFKFTDSGGVTLRVHVPREGWLAFAVGDTGVGIALDQQEVIFEAFRQADGSIHRKYGGTGLGLSISRDLAHLLGGSITVRSAVGEGSVFTLEVPLAFEAAAASMSSSAGSPRASEPKGPPPARPGSVAAPALPAAGAKPEDDRHSLAPGARLILVIEDDAAFAEILRDVARESGFQCIVARTAGEGLAAAQQYVPTAILLDINLPDHSGLGVLDQLKRDARTRHIPVHVASVEDYRKEALELGAVGYALKPAKRDDLVEALRLLELKGTQRIRRVLIVEDDPRQRESIRQLLASDEVRIVAAQNAAEALAQLKGATFDCMVMDFNLPDRSGYDLLATMAEHEDVAFPPVIVYTGRALSTEEEQRLRRYSKSIIIKDARSPERLLDEVTLFLHQVESKLPLERQQMLKVARNRDESLQGRRVLVVEDDVRNIFALSSILEPRGASVDIARNGVEALAKFAEPVGPAGRAIDMVLMDIMMPEMDGYTAMREIRKRPELKKLPIIALTAKAMKDDQEKCLAAGANDYIAKPLDVEKLLSLVRVWMPK